MTVSAAKAYNCKGLAGAALALDAFPIPPRCFKCFAQDFSKFSKCVRDIPFGIAMVGHDGQLLDLNNEARSIIGLGDAWIASGTFIDLFHPDDRHIATRDSSLETREDARMIRGDGGTAWCAIAKVDVDNVGTVFFLHDITAQKEMEVQLVQAREAATAASMAKSIFIAHMSHELRTPLNPIIGFSDILRTASNIEPEQKEWLEAIHGRSLDLLDIVNNILTWSEIESAKTEIHVETFDFRAFLAETLKPSWDAALLKALPLTISAHPGIPASLTFDRANLGHVLHHLVMNAVKFTQDGGIDVSAWMEDSGTTLAMTISDTGAGIPQDAIEHLFEPFNQNTSYLTSKDGRIGLGLAIVRKTIDALGGRIAVESVPTGGTRFSIRLPVVCPSVIAAPAAPYTSTKSVSIPRMKYVGRRALVVENEKVSRELIVHLLVKAGFDVVSAENGLDALRCCGKSTFDIILMDIRMPVLSGIEAAREIRRREASTGRRTPIIAMTAFSNNGDKETHLAEGMDAYLAKPFKLIEIFDSIESCLRASSTTRR